MTVTRDYRFAQHGERVALHVATRAGEFRATFTREAAERLRAELAEALDGAEAQARAVQ